MASHRLDGAIKAPYRASIEHCNGQVKKFEILGGKFRGRLQQSGFTLLQDAVRICTAIVVLQTRRSPLRTHAELAFPAAAAPPPRAFRHGLPLGRATDIVVEHGVERGVGPQPSDAAVNTGRTARDFRTGQRVLVWWWGLWWDAIVQHVAVRNETVTVGWERDHSVTAGYAPRLVRPQ